MVKDSNFYKDFFERSVKSYETWKRINDVTESFAEILLGVDYIQGAETIIARK